jgi:glutamate/tyrosine decarboxylase-like PLP-dependent enzyme
MDVGALRDRLDRGGVGTVVATLGTTATGSVDPLHELLRLREHHDFRVHADAAYGGYFGLLDDLGPDARHAFDALSDADSIVIDPHKHGLQPYGCGCVLFRDPDVGRYYKHDSPYTYFSSGDLHLGEISLECSRPGASAAALWATQTLLPLVRGGEFARRLAASRAAAADLHARIRADRRFVAAFAPELDIVVWTPRSPSASASSQLARRIFHEAEQRQLYLALAELPAAFFDLEAAGIAPDRDSVTCLRSVLMKPEHREWIPRIWEHLDAATSAVMTA